MKARTVVMGLMAAGVMVMAGSGSGSANIVWCSSDPPITVITPGGHNVTVNNRVFLPAGSQPASKSVSEDASAAPDGKGGTLITVNVHVPSGAQTHVVSDVHRFQISAEGDGTYLITTYLDVPIS